MRWEDERQSDNVEDRRGQGGGFGGMSARRGGIGIGAILVALVGGWLLGVNPLEILGLIGGMDEGRRCRPPRSRLPASGVYRPPIRAGASVSTVLASTEDAWTEVFRQGGSRYRPPKLVLFSGATDSACGFAQSASGPFYCPGDEKVYIDLNFFQDMQRRLGARGDFAWAYVIAHEVGHHVQNLLGIMDQMQEKQRSLSRQDYNRYLVRLELQADFLAGIWAHHAQRLKNILETGDIEEAMNAAAAVGDDRIMKREQGHIVPDAFTHGTSAQRLRWFRAGMESRQLSDCDTFARTEP